VELMAWLWFVVGFGDEQGVVEATVTELADCHRPTLAAAMTMPKSAYVTPIHSHKRTAWHLHHVDGIDSFCLRLRSLVLCFPLP